MPKIAYLKDLWAIGSTFLKDFEIY